MKKGIPTIRRNTSLGSVRFLNHAAELVKAHNKLDQEVEKAYGKRFNSDADRVAFLFERYSELIAQEEAK